MHTCFTAISSPESRFRPIYTRPYAPAHPTPVSNHVSEPNTAKSSPVLHAPIIPTFHHGRSPHKSSTEEEKLQLAKFEMHSPDGDPTLTWSRRITFSSKAIDRDEDSREHLTNTVTPRNHTAEGSSPELIHPTKPKTTKCTCPNQLPLPPSNCSRAAEAAPSVHIAFFSKPVALFLPPFSTVTTPSTSCSSSASALTEVQAIS
jgi:hypothetical protein